MSWLGLPELLLEELEDELEDDETLPLLEEELEEELELDDELELEELELEDGTGAAPQAVRPSASNTTPP